MTREQALAFVEAMTGVFEMGISADCEYATKPKSPIVEAVIAFHVGHGNVPCTFDWQRPDDPPLLKEQANARITAFCDLLQTVAVKLRVQPVKKTPRFEPDSDECETPDPVKVAARDLFAACVELLDVIRGGNWLNLSEKTAKRLLAAQHLAEAAIAKATGEPQPQGD